MCSTTRFPQQKPGFVAVQDLFWDKSGLVFIFPVPIHVNALMPLFGKKNPAASGGGSKPDKSGSPSRATTSGDKKTPTVEDKYILKDVLGT